MKKKLWIVIILITVLIAAALGYVYLMPKNAANQNQNQGQDVAPTADETKGKYTPYSEAELKKADGRRVLFFHAAWCPQCRAIENDIKKDGVPKGMTIFKVNYDTETDLKVKYSVTLQTTFVEVDSSGKQIKKFVAYDDPQLSAILKALK